jgi:hypothetical protein
MEMHPAYQALDPFLIWFYRLTGQAWVDFFLGTLVLAFLAVLIGEFTVFLVSLVVLRRLEHKAAEADKYQTLSMDALKAGDKSAYRAANKLANDAFGHSFFQQFTLGAAFLWPVFFALAWMQYRFLDLEFPLPFRGWSLGYIGIFILLYIPALILFKRVKKYLPFFRSRRRLDDLSRQPELTTDNFSHLAEPTQTNGK